jgi:queuine tRNA-ribosyltransferase
MGIGFPEDILEAVASGFDMFDCVIPTRLARHGTLLTTQGRLNIKRSQLKDDFSPLDSQCSCYTCRNFTRAYLHHLFRASELLAIRLNTLHNLHFYMEFFQAMRQAIGQGQFERFRQYWLDRYQRG